MYLSFFVFKKYLSPPPGFVLERYLQFLLNLNYQILNQKVC